MDLGNLMQYRVANSAELALVSAKWGEAKGPRSQRHMPTPKLLNPPPGPSLARDTRTKE